MKVLRRLDQTRVEARKIDCNQRMKLALKSKINTNCGKSYNFGEPVWFKLESSHRWKSGIVVGQDGKVLFIKYANFVRRVPLDHIIPADEYNDGIEEEVNQEDVENAKRLDDDKFENVEIIVQKDREIEQMRKAIEEKENIMKEMEIEITEKRKSIKPTEKKKKKIFPIVTKQ